MNVIWIALAAFIGGIVTALLGWLKSDEPFRGKKFGASIVRALIAAVAFAVAYNYRDFITPIDLGIAFLGGSGVDVLLKRAAGSISKMRK